MASDELSIAKEPGLDRDTVGADYDMHQIRIYFRTLQHATTKHGWKAIVDIIEALANGNLAGHPDRLCRTAN